MASTRFNQPELRKPAGSPRPKGRENSKDTLCRNVLIYGHCRYEDQGCAFNHDPNKTISPPSDSKRSLNVESPAFTPATLPVPIRATTISSQAANAAPFTPRSMNSGTATPNTQPDSEPSTTFNPATIREFTPQNTIVPQNYDAPHNIATNGQINDAASAYDPFSMSTLNSAITTTQFNPYLEEATVPGNSTAYYQSQTAFNAPQQPLQYHLYAPVGPHREDLLAYQRLTHDFFIPNELREVLQKKSEATYQVLQNSQLPVLDQYHSLVPLDTNHNKSATVFGFPSWVYKATSSKTGNTYVLRRLEGFRLSNERAIRSVKDWKRVDNAGVVSVIDAFTTRAFGDSSLIFVYNYHPVSKALTEVHFTSTNRFGNRAAHSATSEQQLWSYVVQIASAIKSVHAASLAIRCMDPSKVLLTDKGRIRLGACSVLDVVQFDANRPLAELQQEDFILFGKLILAIASNNLSVMSPTAQLKAPVEHLARTYSQEFRDIITWLLTPSVAPSPLKDINEFLRGISSHVVSAFDSSLHANDILTSTLSSELENGRLVRLLCKLGSINERPEFDNDPRWSEVGERYLLKLFRDHVFHQVDANGKPVVDLGHILMNLNKLDAGTSQMIKLVSRDEQDVFLVTYKEVKKQVEAAWGELVKGGSAGKRF